MNREKTRFLLPRQSRLHQLKNSYLGPNGTPGKKRGKWFKYLVPASPKPLRRAKLIKRKADCLPFIFFTLLIRRKLFHVIHRQLDKRPPRKTGFWFRSTPRCFAGQLPPPSCGMCHGVDPYIAGKACAPPPWPWRIRRRLKTKSRRC